MKNTSSVKIKDELKENALKVLEKARDIREILEEHDSLLREYLYEFNIFNPKLLRYILKSIAAMNILYSSITTVRSRHTRAKIRNLIADVVYESYSLISLYCKERNDKEIEKATKKLNKILEKASKITS